MVVIVVVGSFVGTYCLLQKEDGCTFTIEHTRFLLMFVLTHSLYLLMCCWSWPNSVFYNLHVCTCRSTLIQHLKESQHNLMTVIMNIMEEAIPHRRASRDFRAKYPDDVLLDQISGKPVNIQVCCEFLW